MPHQALYRSCIVLHGYRDWKYRCANRYKAYLYWYPALVPTIAFLSSSPPEQILYQLVAAYYPNFEAQLAAQGTALPDYVQREFEDYLTFGRLEHGFLRVQCNSCHAEQLVAFRCKRLCCHFSPCYGILQPSVGVRTYQTISSVSGISAGTECEQTLASTQGFQASGRCDSGSEI